MHGGSSVLRQLREETGTEFPSAEAAGDLRSMPGIAVEEPISSVEATSKVRGAIRVAEEVPQDVDVNIFHTKRGSPMLEKLKKPEASDTRAHETVKVGKPDNSKPSLKTGHGQEAANREDVKEPIRPSPVSGVVGRNVEGAKVKMPTPSPDTNATQAPEAEVQARKTAVLDHGEAGIADNGSTPADILPSSSSSSSPPRYELRESKVPATRLSRLWNYGGLAAGMLGGALAESISRAVGGAGEGSVLLSGKNMERLVAKLSRMRGAALKLGQMMSFQDSKMLPGPIQEVLQRVQDRADYMPAWQRDRVLVANLGQDWRELFGEFAEKPMAAASIGQVHSATLKSTGKKVAVKIQFPGVADSINSDLDNLGILLTATKLLPKGLYLNKTIENARTELGWECDYEREAECAGRYKDLLAGEEDVFAVPNIYREASGRQVLTMDYMEGIGVTRIQSFTQDQKDWIGTQILRLCLREITEFNFMQTDPNWTNFLYNVAANKLELLDFGASREYPQAFVTQYVQLLYAASVSDRAAIKALSESLGYLTGHESKTMLDAHIGSVMTLAEPFHSSAPKVYDFTDQTITERVKALIPVMLRERLAPPPEETYSLHRKLSGAFLLCARLGSRVPCRELFEKAVEKSRIPPNQASE
jgi:aarF domain-containing kinase